MKYTSLIALVCVAVSTPRGTLADESLQYRNPIESRGARLARVIYEFDNHRLSHPQGSKILFAQQNWWFTGNAMDLNRFLQRLAELPEAQDMDVYFTGPEPGVKPLTVDAAQSTVAYDWSVRVLEGKVSVVIPLAANIPFHQVRVPTLYHVAADSGSPRIANVFAKLHNEQRRQRLDASPN